MGVCFLYGNGSSNNSNGNILFEKGIIYTSKVGAWTAIRYYWDSTASGAVPSVSWTSNGMSLSTNSSKGPGGLIVTNRAVNLSSYTSIVIECSAVSGNVWCKVSTATGDSFYSKEAATVSLSTGTKTLSISSLSGSYYIGLVGYAGTSMTVTKIYLT